MNTNYQQILLCALALEHRVDLISFFCATEGQAALNPVIGLVNDGLHPELSEVAMDVDVPSDMHDVFCEQWPELIVMLPVRDVMPDQRASSVPRNPVACWITGLGPSSIDDIDRN